MRLRYHEQKREQLYKIYVNVLRKLRDAEEVILKAGIDATNVKNVVT